MESPVKRARAEAVHELRVSDFDVQHYALDLLVDPAERSLQGTCLVSFLPRDVALTGLELDLFGLEVTAVGDAAGNELEFTHSDGILSITLASALPPGSLGEVLVTYGGKPAKGLWFADVENGLPTQVFTQGECEDARWWFPCWDHPSDRATSELRVTVPDNWVTIAAGDLVESSEFIATEASSRAPNALDGGAWRTDHWRMNFAHPTYLTTLVAGEFEVVREEWNGVELLYVVDEDFAKYIPSNFESTIPALEFLSDYTGITYPFSKYSQACVENFPFGGMENISASTLTEQTLGDKRQDRDRSSEGLVVHELAHQWFGDLVTCVDWPHIWLNEGFAVYASLLYVEAVHGTDEFRARMRDTQEAYMAGDVGDNRRPTVHSIYRDPMDLFFGGQTYPGGASRLHMLRHVLGDEAFQDCVQTYLERFAGQNASTEDFRQVAEFVSGEDLGWFFEQWFERPGFPEFSLRWSYNETEQLLTLDVEQTQSVVGGTPSAFTTPVEIEVRDRAGTELHRVWIDRRKQSFEFAVESKPEWVRFDKHGFIPKTVKWIGRRDAEWLMIAREDDDVNGRRDAVRALAKRAAETSRTELLDLYVAELVNRLEFDTSAYVRADAAAGLSGIKRPQTRVKLTQAAESDPSADVRVAALEALISFGQDERLAGFARKAFKDGYSWKTMGSAARLLASAAPDQSVEWLISKLLVDSPHDTLRASLLETLGQTRSAKALEHLERWAMDPAAHPNARAAAVMQLGDLVPTRYDVGRDLAGLLNEPDYRLRGAVIKALAEFIDPASRQKLRDYYERTVFPRERRAIEASMGTALTTRR